MLWQRILDQDSQIITVHLLKQKPLHSSLGVRIESIRQPLAMSTEDKTSSLHNGHLKSRHRHYIRSIQRASPVHLSQQIHTGDELLEVNGIKLYGESHEAVLSALRRLPTHVRLVCARQPSLSGGGASSSQSSPRGSHISELVSSAVLQRRHTTLSRGSRSSFDCQSMYSGRRSSQESDWASSLAASDFRDDTDYALFDPQLLTKGNCLNDALLTDGVVEWSSEPILIQLKKKDRGLGFTIISYQGHSQSNNRSKLPHRILIYSIEPNGLANEDGRLSVCDQILFVNDRSMTDVTSVKEASEILKHPRGKVILGILKPLASKQSRSDPVDDRKEQEHLIPILDEELIDCPSFPDSIVKNMIIERKESSLGWILTTVTGLSRCHGCRIREVLPDGDIQRDGRLQSGDFILAINGRGLGDENMADPMQFVDFMKKLDNSRENIVIGYISQMAASKFVLQEKKMLTLKASEEIIEESNGETDVGVAINEALDSLESGISSSTEPETPLTVDVLDVNNVDIFPVELVKNPVNQSLGLSVLGPRKSGEDNAPEGIVIESIKDNSPASHCAKLHPGDILLEVNGISLRHCDHAKAVNILREAASPVKLIVERIPKPCQCGPDSPDDLLKKTVKSQEEEEVQEQEEEEVLNCTDCVDVSRKVDTSSPPPPNPPGAMRHLQTPVDTIEEAFVCPDDQTNLCTATSLAGSNSSRIVCLRRGSTGLGFTLKWDANDGLCVAGIMPGTAAWSAGLKRGDRLEALNSVLVGGMTLEDVEECLAAVRLGDQVELCLI